MHGKGKISYANGDTYDGEFETNQRKGFGLLISNNFPALNKKYLLRSSIQIFERALTYVTVERVEDWKLLNKAEALRDEFERLYFKMERMEDLKEDELVHVISQFLQDNVMTPAKESYLANKHVTTQSVECAEFALCAMNEHARKGNRIVAMASFAGHLGGNESTWSERGQCN